MWHLLLYIPMLDPALYFSSIVEPDYVIFILQESASHCQNLIVIDFTNIETHFIDLFQTIIEMIVLQKVLISSKFSEIVEDLLMQFPLINRSIEFNGNRFAYADWGFNTRLY